MRTNTFCSSFHSMYLSVLRKSRKSVSVLSAFLTQVRATWVMVMVMVMVMPGGSIIT